MSFVKKNISKKESDYNKKAKAHQKIQRQETRDVKKK